MLDFDGETEGDFDGYFVGALVTPPVLIGLFELCSLVGLIEIGVGVVGC